MIEIKTEINLKELKKEQKKLKSNYYLRKAAAIGEAIAVNQAPVDTGLLRANFFVTPNGNDKKLIKSTEHKKSSAGVIIKKNELFILNNIFYTLYANVTSFRPQYIEKTISKIILTLKSKSFYNSLD